MKFLHHKSAISPYGIDQKDNGCKLLVTVNLWLLSCCLSHTLWIFQSLNFANSKFKHYPEFQGLQEPYIHCVKVIFSHSVVKPPPTFSPVHRRTWCVYRGPHWSSTCGWLGRTPDQWLEPCERCRMYAEVSWQKYPRGWPCQGRMWTPANTSYNSCTEVVEWPAKTGRD